jgi:hypothetical protein
MGKKPDWTGLSSTIHPFNPDVVASDMLAPTKESSTEGHLPLAPPTPIHAVANSDLRSGYKTGKRPEKNRTLTEVDRK